MLRSASRLASLTETSGPLKGVVVLEIAGLAPSPFAGLVLADFGATVIRVDRTRAHGISTDRMCRGKLSIGLNLKSKLGASTLLRLVDEADVLIEPFRPGVMERLGLGPDIMHDRNPGLVYARMTGFGQDGPFKDMAGHDINYISITGVLSMLGRKGEAPFFPTNLLGDFAGGGLMCALGIVMALFERATSGKGQVVDAAMVDGAAYVSSFLFRNLSGLYAGPRGTNLLDSGAPFYDTYETSDGEYMAVGAIEPQFYAQLLKGLELDDDDSLPPQMDMSRWDELRAKLKEVFLSRTAAEWTAVFDTTDACVTPVVGVGDVMNNPHSAARGLLREDGAPAPAPRLSRTPATPDALDMPTLGEHTRSVLTAVGFSDKQVDELEENGVAAKSSAGKQQARL